MKSLWIILGLCLLAKAATTLTINNASLVLNNVSVAISPVSSQSIVAASCSRADVVAAIALASDGDTVVIPAGTCSWTTTVTNTKAITLQGAGIGNTIIQDDISIGGGSSQNVLQWITSAGQASRITGIEFEGGATTGRGFDTGAVQISGLSTQFRLDNCRFENLDNENVYVQNTFGVIDHCEAVLNAGGYRFVMFFHPNIYGGNYGDGSWETSISWGSAAALYVENCTVTKTVASGNDIYGWCDGWMGGRLVARFNSLTNVRMSNHGTESSQRYRGGRYFEIYGNNITNTSSFTDSCITMRSGSAVICSNNIVGIWGSDIKLESYRNTTGFAPWGIADGTKDWDTATNGTFDSGTATSGGTNFVTDTGKSWTPNQWITYLVRQTSSQTASSGGVRSAVVSGAGWTVNQWSEWEFTKTSDDTKGKVTSNTSDTLTLDTSCYAVDMTGGGAFVLSRTGYIISNTTDTLTVSPTIEGANYIFTNFPYAILLTGAVLDDPGRGATTAITGSPPNHQSLGQGFEPIYQWENYDDGVPVTITNPWQSLVNGRNYTNNVAMPGYVPYTYPHPLIQ